MWVDVDSCEISNAYGYDHVSDLCDGIIKYNMAIELICFHPSKQHENLLI